MHKKFLVTGATGFIGQHLLHALLPYGQVIVICRDKKNIQSLYPKIEVLEQSLTTPIPKKYLGPDTSLVHLAWPNLPNYTQLFHFEDTLMAQYQFIKQSVLQGITHVMITGTCFEYGLQEGGLSAKTLPQPVTAYGLAKHCLHEFLRTLQKTHSFILQWARLFYVYGEGQNPKALLPSLQAAIDNQEKKFCLSLGEQLRDFIDVKDVVSQLMEHLMSAKNITFNVCTEKPISVRRFVENYIKTQNATIELKFGHYPYLPYEPLAFWGIKDTVLYPN